MAGYVLVSTIVGFITNKMWYSFLFPDAYVDSVGSEDRALLQKGRYNVATCIALVAVSISLATLFRNDLIDSTGVVDSIHFALRIWLGILVPVIYVMWSGTQAGVRTLIGHTGYWLVVIIELSIIAGWVL